MVFSGQIDRTQQFDGQNHLSPYLWMVFWMVKPIVPKQFDAILMAKTPNGSLNFSPRKSTQRSPKGGAASYKLV